MNIYPLAQEICQKLNDCGYTAYFAGGWVRDLVLGQKSDEIDIATNAPPSIIQQLFSKTVPVGIAFGVVIVVIEGVNFELSTFRKDHAYLDGRHPEGVDFSTPQQDAERRDFTINGMFYDPLSNTLLDYVGGQEDLMKGVIRAIGNPFERFLEDRLRMIRAIRFAARLNFTIEPATYEAIRASSATLFPAVSMERIWQELTKMAKAPNFDKALGMLHQAGLLSTIFPQLKHVSLKEIEKMTASFSRFPTSCPPIAYLLELFPKFSLEERLQLCLYLKTPAHERKWAEFITHSEALLARPSIERYEWAHFYAHPFSQLFIGITAAKSIDPERFLQEHEERQKGLSKHILRIQNKKPLVTTMHLQQIGIQPGIEMGVLLKKAERIAIQEDCESAEEVLSLLSKM